MDKSQRVIVDFVNNHTHLINKSRSNFVFMHHRAPKAPYEKNRDCKDQRFINGYKGYQESYFCTLKEIDYFMEYIRKNDPDAIVVFQADHGQKSEILFDGSGIPTISNNFITSCLIIDLGTFPCKIIGSAICFPIV